jgi:deoxyribonuclease V
LPIWVDFLANFVQVNAINFKSMQLEEMALLQERLACNVIIPLAGRGYAPSKADVILTLDVQYVGDTGYVAVDAQQWEARHIEIFAVHAPVTEPYVPGYFAFREGPVLEFAVRKVIEWLGEKPSLIIVDGHGTAHPRKFGVACWLGLQLGIPVLGCAKETLVQYEGALEEAVGSRLPVMVEGETVGFALRTALGVKPVFVSPGHLISLSESVRVVLGLGAGFRVIEPLRRADMACRAYARGEHGVRMTYLD